MKDLSCPRCNFLMKLSDVAISQVYECLNCSTCIHIENNVINFLLLYLNEYAIYSYPRGDYLSVYCDNHQFNIDSFLIDFENLDKFYDYIKCYHLLEC